MRRLGLLLATFALIASPASAAEPFGGLATQMRLTAQGPDGNPRYDATTPDVAYNSKRDEFFLVWQGQDLRAPDEVAIYGRRLDGAGKPVSDAIRISAVGEYPEEDATDPSVAYDFERDRYAVVYSAYPLDVNLQMLAGDGTPSGPPTNVADPQPGLEPTVAFNPLDDRFLVVFTGAVPLAFPGQPVVLSRLVDAISGDVIGQVHPLDAPAGGPTGRATEFSATWRPDNRYVVAWSDGAGHPDSWYFVVQVLAEHDGVIVQEAAQPNTEPEELRTGRSPALAATPYGDDVLIVYSAKRSGSVGRGEGPEVFIRRVSADGAVGSAEQVSSAGPAASGDRYEAVRPAIAFSPRSGQFLVTWQGTDDGRPGLSDVEPEITGRMVDSTGKPAGEEFLISRMGTHGSDEVGPNGTGQGIAVSSRTGEFLAVWSGDDGRPPLAFGEDEVWGRWVGPNPPRDDDQDGVVAASDCDDTNPDVRPGAKDIPYNNLDEDCSGRDSHDFDQDGYEPPRDCDDTNALVHPKAFDIPGNRQDEDCSGRDRVAYTAARVRAAWFFNSTATTVARLAVEGASKSMSVRVSCSGRGCPGTLRGAGRSLQVRRRTLVLTRLLKHAQLRAGATVTVRITERGTVGLVERFEMRAGKPPRQVTRCLQPGRKRATRCP